MVVCTMDLGNEDADAWLLDRAEDRIERLQRTRGVAIRHADACQQRGIEGRLGSAGFHLRKR